VVVPGACRRITVAGMLLEDAIGAALLAVVVGALTAPVGLAIGMQGARRGPAPLGPTRSGDAGLAVLVTGLVALILGVGGIAFAVLKG
jgi:hypothetical protein